MAGSQKRAGLTARMGGGFYSLAGVQALVEYGVLNSLARDASMTMQRLGGWAAENWYITGGVLGIVIYASLRPRR